jgi:hypothetical protein
MNKKPEKLSQHRVTYTLEHQGKFYIIENVPTRVDEDTGEQYFSPVTVERLQKAILGEEKPSRTIETPVYRYVD